jgi:hypothetical protein
MGVGALLAFEINSLRRPFEQAGVFVEFCGEILGSAAVDADNVDHGIRVKEISVAVVSIEGDLRSVG